MDLTTSRFQKDLPVLILAPHLELPLRNGADIATYHIYGQLSRHVSFVTILTQNQILTFNNGSCTGAIAYNNCLRSKRAAALRTLFRRTNYFLERFLTPAFVSTAIPYLRDSRYGTVVFSYICTAILHAYCTPDKFLVIQSHNNDFEWFRNLRRSSQNPIAKLVAYLSERWTGRFMNQYAGYFHFHHVSQDDHRAYTQRIGAHSASVIPVGVNTVFDDLDAVNGREPSTITNLLFVGSLSNKMNEDALRHFQHSIFPTLRYPLGNGLTVTVAGSHPTDQVRYMCIQNGWRLHANLNDEDLRAEILNAHFTLLPFSYITGAKLKLLESLIHGVPFLATSNIQALEKVIHPCLISDDPEAWLLRIQDVRHHGIPAESRLEMIKYAQNFSWEAIANYAFDCFIAAGDGFSPPSETQTTDFDFLTLQ